MEEVEVARPGSAQAPRALSVFAEGLVGVAAVAAVAMMVLDAANVATRYFLNWSVPGVVEMTIALMVPLVVLPWAATQISGGHVQVTVLLDRARGRRAVLAHTAALACALAYLGAAAWVTGALALDSLARNEYFLGDRPILASPGRLAIFVGLAAFAIAVCWDIWRLLQGLGRQRGRSDDL